MSASLFSQYETVSIPHVPAASSLTGIEGLVNMKTAIRMQIVDELRQAQRMLSEDWETNLTTSALMIAGVALKLSHEAVSR